jgi:ribulose-bisphosphate carboxylase large chain
MGLETAATAASDDGLRWLAHPAGAGVYTEPDEMGVAAHLVFGTLTRLAGADLCIYPGSGGRISTQGGDEDRIARSLTGPLAGHKATLPCTGGGKSLAQAPEVAAVLGPDCAIVVGGDLLRLGPMMEDGVRSTIERLKAV